MKRILSASLLMCTFFLFCKSSDLNKQDNINFRYRDPITKKEYFVSCDSACSNCIGYYFDFVSGRKDSTVFPPGDLVYKRCKKEEPPGSGDGDGGDTSTSIDSLASMLLVRFLPADSTANKYGFDDWIEDSSRHDTKTSYLSVAAGCSAKFMVSIRLDTCVHDSYKVSIESDKTNNLYFDSLFSRTDTFVQCGNTVLTLYSRDDEREGTAWIHVYGISGANEVCYAGKKGLFSCKDAEEQLCIEVHNKTAFLPLVYQHQGSDYWCWAAVSSMVLQWYYRKSLHDYYFQIYQDDIVSWTWGSTTGKARSQGVPMCNMLGAYNTDCADKGPQDTLCPGCGECKTCEHLKPDSGLCSNSDTGFCHDSGYDPTCDMCCDMRWYVQGPEYVMYTGKNSVCGKPLPSAGPVTQFAWGITCILKTARKRWPDIGIGQIPNSCWGLMQPEHVASQLDKCRPIIIEYGTSVRHNVVIIGYTLEADTASEDMMLHYMDPFEPKGKNYYISQTWKRISSWNWNQSIFIEYSAPFTNDCKLIK